MKKFIVAGITLIAVMSYGLNYAQELPPTPEHPPKSESPPIEVEYPATKEEGPITEESCLEPAIEYTEEPARQETTDDKGPPSEKGRAEDETEDKPVPILEGVEFGFPEDSDSENSGEEKED